VEPLLTPTRTMMISVTTTLCENCCQAFFLDGLSGSSQNHVGLYSVGRGTDGPSTVPGRSWRTVSRPSGLLLRLFLDTSCRAPSKCLTPTHATSSGWITQRNTAFLASTELGGRSWKLRLGRAVVGTLGGCNGRGQRSEVGGFLGPASRRSRRVRRPCLPRRLLLAFIVALNPRERYATYLHYLL